MKWIAIALSLFVSGCATTYQKNGMTGGYSEVKVSGDVWRVKFSGNGYANRETVQTYWLFRCAELAMQEGFDGFEVLTPMQLGLHLWSIDPNVQQVAQLIMIPMYAPPTPVIEGDIRLVRGIKVSRPPKAFASKDLTQRLEVFVKGKKCSSNNVCPHVKTYLGVSDSGATQTSSQ